MNQNEHRILLVQYSYGTFVFLDSHWHSHTSLSQTYFYSFSLPWLHFHFCIYLNPYSIRSHQLNSTSSRCSKRSSPLVFAPSSASPVFPLPLVPPVSLRCVWDQICSFIQPRPTNEVWVHLACVCATTRSTRTNRYCTQLLRELGCRGSRTQECYVAVLPLMRRESRRRIFGNTRVWRKNEEEDIAVHRARLHLHTYVPLQQRTPHPQQCAESGWTNR